MRNFLDFSIFCRYDCVKDQQSKNNTGYRRFFMLKLIVLVVLTLILTGFFATKVFNRFHLTAEGSQSDFVASLMFGLFISYFLVYKVLW